MPTLEDRLKDPEYRDWVKSTLCLQYTRDGLVHFCDLKSQELKKKITQALPLRGNPPVYNLCPNIKFDFFRKSISCYCNNCNDILLEVKRYLTGISNLNLKNSDPKQLLLHHWQCSKLYMNTGQDVTSTTPKDTDINGLLNFIDHCSVPRGCITNPDNLKQVRDTRNRVLHTSDMKVTNNDFQNVITPLLIDLLEDPGFLLKDQGAITAVDMIKDVKKADFIITKDDEEKALYAFKDEIQRMYELARDEMSKLTDRVDTLSKDVSSLKQDELKILQDGVTKNDTDISEVKQMYETLREKVEQSNDMHLQLNELQEETKSMVENHNTLHCKVMDIQRELVTMQQEIDENRQDIVKISEEQTELKEKQAEDRQDIVKISEEQTELKEKQAEDRQDIVKISEEQTELKEKQAEDRQDIVKISEEQTELKEKQAEDRQDIVKISEEQTKDRQRQEHLSKVVEEIRNKDEPLIPSEEDKLELQEFLRVAYTRAKKLDVTLLPEWEPLHVSEIFSPAILAGNKQLRSYKEIFYEDGKLQKRVVLLGEAGRGKTTFCKHLTDIWRGSTSVSQFSDIDVLKKFGYLFYVSCRFAKEEETILNMITDQVLGSDDKMIVPRYVLKYLPNLCLIIVDGLDELAGSPTADTGRMDDIAGLPGLAGVEDCVILITSRPWRFNSLSCHAQNVFMRLNIDGIKNVKELSQKVLHQLEDPTPEISAEEFLRLVEERNMSDLMKNPLILIIALRGWVGDNDDETVRSLHKSVCINYINMIQSLIRRSEGQAGWPRSESKLRQLVPNFENLKSEWGKKSNELSSILSRYKAIQRYAGLLLSVGQLAFDLLLGTEEQSLVFSKAKVKKYLPADDENEESINACLALGIITKTETTTRGLKKLESYAFCHKTFQEFFAALWLASKYETEKTKLYKRIKTVRNLQGFEMLIRFLCGFDTGKGKQFWIYITEKVELEVSRYFGYNTVQDLACRCTEEHEVDPKNQESGQIYFCIPHITIGGYTSDEDIMLLCHVMEEYYSSVKSVEVSYLKSQHQGENICKSISSCSGLRNIKLPLDSHLGSTVLDLRTHNKLEKLELNYTSVESLLVPGEGATITLLDLNYVTMTHHSLEQLAESLSFCLNLLNIRLMRVRCCQHADGICIPVIDLRKHSKLEKLVLWQISVDGLLLPWEGATITSLQLSDVTMTHHGLEQLGVCLSFSISLVNMNLLQIRCSEHIYGACIQKMDLQKLNKLKELRLKYISVEGLLLPEDGITITSLELNSVTMTRRGLKQLKKSLSSCRGLVNVDIGTLTCSEDGTNVCIPALNLQKHNALDNLKLVDLSVKGLLLPLKGATISSLELSRVIMTHEGLQQLEQSLSSCPSIVHMYVGRVTCSKHSFDVCIPFLNLQKHSRINLIKLVDLSVKGLLLPTQDATITSLELDSVTMTHHGLIQLGQSLTSCQSLQNVNLTRVKCSEDIDKVCIPVLNLQTKNKLEKLTLRYISVKGLLLPGEGATITSLELRDVTMTHHGSKQMVRYLSSCCRQVELYKMTCSEQNPLQNLQVQDMLESMKLDTLSVKGHLRPPKEANTTSLQLHKIMPHQSLDNLWESLSYSPNLVKLELWGIEFSDLTCITILDLKKHNKLRKLELINISVKDLLLPGEGATITSLELDNVTMTHHSLEQLAESLSFCLSLLNVDLWLVRCSDHDDGTCIPVIDLQKHNKLEKLVLSKISVGGLLLPLEGTSITSLELFSVTMTHHGLKQLGACISVFDLRQHNKLEKLVLNNISVKGLLLPGEGATITSLELDNVTMTNHGLEQFAESLSFCISLLNVYLTKVRCSEQAGGTCIPAIDLRKRNKLEKLKLNDISVKGLLLPGEGATITSLRLYNVSMAHHGLEQLAESLSFCVGSLDVNTVRCCEHADGVCIPGIDLRKHNQLEKLVLSDISIEGLLPPGEGTTSLFLRVVTMNHHGLEQLVKNLSSLTRPLCLNDVRCSKHGRDSSCQPLQDLHKLSRQNYNYLLNDSWCSVGRYMV